MWPDWTTTITRPGWKCQPEKPCGAYVIVCTWTSVGSLVWSLIRSLFTWTLSERVARWARIVAVAPAPGLASAIVAPDPAIAVMPARQRTSFRKRFIYLLLWSGHQRANYGGGRRALKSWKSLRFGAVSDGSLVLLEPAVLDLPGHRVHRGSTRV